MNLAPWQQALWQNLAQRRVRNALPHALLLAGPEGLGKRVFADAFIQFLLCETTDNGYACGRCRACLLNQAGNHPDRITITLEPRDDGKLSSEIIVDQVRALSERVAMTSQFGGYQCVSIVPAEAMNVSASNALLKTLEEPTPNTLFLLVSHQPARLPATIRSRCQRLDFRLPQADIAYAWLIEQGISGEQAEQGLLASGGNPGLALEWARSGTLAMRVEIAEELRALHAGRAAPLEVANRWSQSDIELRLWLAAALSRDEARAQANKTIGPIGLTAAVDFNKLAVWFDQVNRLRAQLQGPLRSELGLLEVVMAWCALAPSLKRA